MQGLIEFLRQHPDVLAAFLSAVATGLSAIATGLAAYATWQGPRSAAKLAEQLRSEAERSAQARNLKLHVFGTLMQERAFVASIEGVKALNLIDVVYYSSRNVREAWAELYNGFNQNVPPYVKDERLRRLLREMALDLGIGEDLRPDDFGRIYYPNALAQENQIRLLQREQTLRTLQGSPQGQGSPSPGQTSGLWPPAPE